MEWQTTKTSQKNVGNHYCKQNLLVYSSTGPGSASPPVEFELTRNQHMERKRATTTVTAMFKGPPDGLIGEAWRILLAATTGKLLLPDWAQQYRKKHVALWEGKEPVSDSNPGEPTTGPPPVEEPPPAVGRRPQASPPCRLRPRSLPTTSGSASSGLPGSRS